MPKKMPHYHLKIKIAVSGAAETAHCAESAFEKAKELGREVIRQKCVLINGATTGFPFWSAMGAKEEEGFCIGLSPASSEKEHVQKFNLPVDYMDMIIYTGSDYSGRNLLMTRAADGIIVGCGRMGTLNEFTIAFEDRKPIGVLTGSGGTTDLIENIIKEAHRGPGKVIFDKDPKKLVKRLIELIKEEKVFDV